MTYKEKLKDPRWQKKRLEIMDRDGFQCQICFDRDKTLTVHHKYYSKNTDPWDYFETCYITLCEDCHDSVHLWEKQLKLHPERFELFSCDCNITDYRILRERIKMIQDREGRNSIKSVIKLLTAYIIDLKDI